ncbi:protein of unknown function [Lysobacter spongiicola DSM 21749]|uniref:DUF4426 domain-containing protein n=2 Tax=Novilysobacter TaxID=3382699 RepID=A0A1T4RC48_9GAMM|nr:protein of unknown function [Lysobacter spongiicola DSM 21749]
MGSATTRMTFIARTAGALLGLAMLAGCDGGLPPVSTPVDAPTEAVSTVGDATVRASVVTTGSLGQAVADRYGIERGDDIVMLLVGLRRGEGADEVSVPARITATASDLRGQRHSIEMRELQSGELLDYVGTLQVDMPETLRFEVQIVREDGSSERMEFTREFSRR